MARLGWLVPAILLLAACSASSSPTATTLSRGGGTSGEAASKAVGAPAPDARAQAGDTANGVPVPQAFDTGRAVILSASIALRASDPWAVADKAQAVAAGLGGDVIGLAQSGTKDEKVATLTLRVPSDRFTDALRQLRGLDAEVVSSNVEGKDVTDQFVDLKARLAAKQGEEQRYLALLTRADKIDDILKIDQALGSVRTQIEQLQGQVNSISSRTQFSTISVSITPVAAPLPTPGTAWDPARTIALAVAALTTLLRGLADLAIWLLVLGWIPLLALALAYAIARGRRGVRGTAPTM